MIIFLDSQLGDFKQASGKKDLVDVLQGFYFGFFAFPVVHHL